MEKYDVIVIGGGLLGAFAARNLTRYKLKTALLEAREDLCTGISRANTAIVYSGCDTKPGTLKTTMCVRGSQNFAQLCMDLDVRYSPCGSLMVAFGESGANILRKKFRNGIQNGVQGIKILSSREILALEPNIPPNVHSGLFAPHAGTVMPWELCFAAAENATDNGTEIHLNTEVTQISRIDKGYRLTSGGKQFLTRSIINCAGMESYKLHKMVSEPKVRISPSAGDYLVLDTTARSHISHVIFHEPEEKGKGLTLVPTVDGNILIGPTERPDDGEYGATSQEGFAQLKSLAAEVMPSLPMDQVIRGFGAVRPNPRYIADDRSVNDFCILEDGAFISLIGIKTPGLTCSDELGRYVADKMAQKLGVPENPDFNPRRIGQIRFSDLSFNDRARETKDPAYAQIVCRCRGISEGEIIDAVRRGAVTVDGVKRRTGSGSGRCQGSFCGQRVIEILARELECTPKDIIKDGGGSYILL
ncbi:MAG: NAD(P)/FAD-dependent oxidoreductase [Oscillospiraceae bacterium]|nr:NAD(P)/FAD-dependent oxidoreductase [Oscillospiraceae bacterium]